MFPLHLHLGFGGEIAVLIFRGAIGMSANNCNWKKQATHEVWEPLLLSYERLSMGCISAQGGIADLRMRFENFSWHDCSPAG